MFQHFIVTVQFICMQGEDFCCNTPTLVVNHHGGICAGNMAKFRDKAIYIYPFKLTEDVGLQIDFQKTEGLNAKLSQCLFLLVRSQVISIDASIKML
jgi:hypothetical protein